MPSLMMVSCLGPGGLTSEYGRDLTTRTDQVTLEDEPLATRREARRGEAVKT